jgi:hypothetical protein
MEFNRYSDTYERFSDKTIRNRPTNEGEEAYAEMLADKEVKAFLAKYEQEPGFKKRLGRKLAVELMEDMERQTKRRELMEQIEKEERENNALGLFS